MSAFSLKQGAYFEFVKSISHEPFNMPSVKDLGSQLEDYSLPRNFVLTLKSDFALGGSKAYLDYIDLITIAAYQVWQGDSVNHSNSSHLELIKNYALKLHLDRREFFLNELQFVVIRFLSSYSPSGVEVCSCLQNMELKPNVLWRVYSTSWGTWSPRLRSGRPMPPYVSFLLSTLFLYRSSGYEIPEVEELMQFSVVKKKDKLIKSKKREFKLLKNISFRDDEPVGVPLSQSKHWFETNSKARLCFKISNKKYELNAAEAMQLYLNKTIPDHIPQKALEDDYRAEIHIVALAFFLVSLLSFGTVSHLYFAFKAYAEFMPDMQLSFKSLFQSMPPEKDKPRSAMPHTVIFPYLLRLGKLDGIPYGGY